MIEPAGPGGTATRAFLRVGGVTIARHQLALLLSLGCEKVICLARTLESDVIALQHAVEGAGLRFHAVTGPRGLMGLVTAVDEVLVLNEGLLTAPEAAAAWFEAGPGVAVQPVEAGLAAGFERIDARLASAGALRIPGRLVERLSDLPTDCDALSTLQRIALQAGVPQRPLADAGSGRWLLVRDEAEAQGAELSWIRLHTAPSGVTTPSGLIARLAVRAFGPSLLHAGSGGNAVTIAAGALLLIGLGSGWFGLGTFALCLCALAALLRKTGGLLSRVERDSLQLAAPRLPRDLLFGWLLDAFLIIIIAWNTVLPAGAEAERGYFAPLILLALLRLLPRTINDGWAAWLEDRMVLSLFLAGAALAGKLDAAVHLLAAVLALTAIVWPTGRFKLTRA